MLQKKKNTSNVYANVLLHVLLYYTNYVISVSGHAVK